MSPAKFVQAHGKFGIPVASIKPLVKYMVSQGIELEKLLEGSNITLSDFTQINRTLLFEQFLKLIINARKLTPVPEYALLLGEHFFIHHDDVLACRVMSSESTLSAMKLLTQYQNLFTQLLDLNLEIIDGVGIFSINEKLPLGDAFPHFVEYSCAVLFCLGRFCLGKNEIDLEFELAHENPGNGDEFSSFFGNTVRFNCSHNRIIISKNTLKQAIIFSNIQNAQENEKLCKQHLKQVNNDQKVIREVKQCIRSMPFNEVSLEVLADKLCMSTRSLRRHLQGQGVSYKSLLENERKRIALKRIEKQDVSIEKLAELLGYHNASSFSRAFKRWFGVSPQHYKIAQKTPSIS